MVIIWSELAKNNLKEFIDNTKMERKNALQYVTSLVKYTESLREYNSLGKVLFSINSLEIRQLIYRNHRIFYSMSNNEITIITVIHTVQNLKTTITSIKQILAK